MTPTIQMRPGDPAPWFKAHCGTNPNYSFDTVAGRYVLLAFFGPADGEMARVCRAAIAGNRELFDDDKLCFFGITSDPRERAEPHCPTVLPGIRYFFDADLAVAKQFGAFEQGPDSQSNAYRCFWLVLDPMLRVVGRVAFTTDDRHVAAIMSLLRRLPPVDHHAETVQFAPVLVLPRVFEPDLCRRLIGYYDDQGGKESGFMRDVGGKTVGIVDRAHKQRFDCTIEDEDLRNAARSRIERRLIPEIRKCFQFKVTRMERYIVACYDAESGGHFNAHRDDTTFGTAHRRFACTINLNAESYQGGDLSFPEFGTRQYRAPTGGAVVFSCSLLHKVHKVTDGKRYAFLPFLYDEAAARVRAQNNARLGEDVGEYRGLTPQQPAASPAA
ncbi:MAG TPA: 2OG-Fe(II) oxygenase [Geminicoccaceae bacterium]|nr:2OG-Fe(II) oxygenase [Geminicoccus sp.]HMU49078.1 2OG-Fe(II) oxygenase [Geminicoccaceae bacterium]